MVLSSSSAVVAIPDRPARAASCLAEGCDGKWPGEQGCITADIQELGARTSRVDIDTDWPDETPDHGGIEFDGTAFLYYSPACRASWTELVIAYWEDGINLKPTLQFWAQPQYGGRRQRVATTQVEGHPEIVRSALASWNYSIQMCFVVRFADQPESTPDEWDADVVAELCTEWK
jgi:hypothetical protein